MSQQRRERASICALYQLWRLVQLLVQEPLPGLLHGGREGRVVQELLHYRFVSKQTEYD